MVSNSGRSLVHHPVFLILFSVLVKLPMLFTGNIQEDSFITWRVAKNLVRYGVIGFNPAEKISASTTHLYMFTSAGFYYLFGDHFILPLLLFSSILFSIGTYWLAKIFFAENRRYYFPFILLINLIPPALTASLLGMEYGILFFLYAGLLYFGFYKNYKWAYIIFPILLLWTRIDTVIFLGIFFLGNAVFKKRMPWLVLLGGVVGLISVISFNYWYFNELVNHTITAKKIAYKNLMQDNSLQFLLYQWAYYGGLIKKYSLFTFIVFLIMLAAAGYSIFWLVKRNNLLTSKAKAILLTVVCFGLAKITVFAMLRAYFDWYYWLPRVFLLLPIILFFLLAGTYRMRTRMLVLFPLFAGLFMFQWVQSYTIGYMEERQRFQIAADIERLGAGPEQSILLEPAGIIPFYTELYTYDEVGLVQKEITAEMLKDENYWWSNSVQRFKPTYLLTIAAKPAVGGKPYILKEKEGTYFSEQYELVKTYPISRIHENAPALLRFIYKLRPIGKDYFLYQRKTGTP